MTRRGRNEREVKAVRRVLCLDFVSRKFHTRSPQQIDDLRSAIFIAMIRLSRFIARSNIYSVSRVKQFPFFFTSSLTPMSVFVFHNATEITITNF